MSHHNRAALERALQAIGAGATGSVGDFFTPDWVNHDPSLPPMQGLEGAVQLMRLWSTAFSNIKLEIEDTVEADDKVAGRFRIMGTHTGPLMGIPASGKPISVLATGIFRVVDGKLAENWVNIDALSLMQQIGAIPAQDRPPA